MGCGAAGTAPHDMSVTDHQAAASQEEQEATTHAEHRHAETPSRRGYCPQRRTERRVCWSDVVRANEEHERRAREHREMAERHRAAAAALVQAEAKACTGIDELDRDMSPFAHREDTERAYQLQETTVDAQGRYQLVTVGAEVVFRPVPGLTVEWLQRLVDCHLARNAALGHDVPEMEYCPLVPKGVSATVTAAGDGFVVKIRGQDESAGQEILRRALALVD